VPAPMPASVVALGTVPMVDEMPVVGNGVASLGSTLSELPQPTCIPTSVVSLSPSSQALRFQLPIEWCNMRASTGSCHRFSDCLGYYRSCDSLCFDCWRCAAMWILWSGSHVPPLPSEQWIRLRLLLPVPADVLTCSICWSVAWQLRGV
jgi:hypothetical protein